jgi:hypothetical protein
MRTGAAMDRRSTVACFVLALGLWGALGTAQAQPPPPAEEDPYYDDEEVAGYGPEGAYPVGYRGRVDYHHAHRLAPPLGGYVELSLHGTVIVRQSGGPEQLERGGGFSLLGGLHLGPRFALELAWFQSYHNPLEIRDLYGRDVDFLVLDGLTIGARFNLLPIDLAVPYLRVGIGPYALGSRFFGLDSAGLGVHLGLGVDFWLTDFFTLGVGATYRGIAMGPPDAAFDDTFISMLNFQASIGFHF